MVLAASLIEKTRGYLQGASDEDQSSTLVTVLDNNDLTFTVNPARGLATSMSAGLIEIGTELIWCDGIAVDGTCTIPPWGRGFRGTTAAAHSVGDRIVSQPRYPRQWTLDEINVAINRVFPNVWVVKHYNTVTTTPQITYDVPNDFEWVLKAEWMVPDGRNYWRDVTYLRSNEGGRPITSDNSPDKGITLDMAEQVQPGQPFHIAYAAQPTLLSAETDDFDPITSFGTVFFNGLLVQNHFELKGHTLYIGKPFYKAHDRAPIKLQAHGDKSEPLSYRNIWVRELE